MSSKLLSLEELIAEISKIVRDSYHATGTTVAHALLKKYLIIDSPKIDYKTDESFDITADGVTIDGTFVHYDNYRDAVPRLLEAADDFREMEAVTEAYKEFDTVSGKLKELAAKLYITTNLGLVSAVTTISEKDFTYHSIPHHERSRYLELAKSALNFIEENTPKPAPSTPEFKKTAPTSPWQGRS
jgi:hypothetical protein